MQVDLMELADDQPKTNPWTQDRLGYSPFAEQLAKVIVGLQAPNGYVIGLHGQWGSGKSTVLNFVRAFIDKHNAEIASDGKTVTIVDFRPWIVSGHQDLIAAFFKVLSESLGPREGRLRRIWKHCLRLVGGTTDNLVDAAATVALTVDPSGGVATGFVGDVTKKSVNGLIGQFLEDPSLQRAYEDLKEQLRNSGRRFFVPIDDIDRLELHEIKAIMQMVKTLGRLPNVVYALAYDRRIVWGVLDQRSGHEGPRYAEKIVQQEIELPKPPRNALFSMLDQEISFLSGQTGGSLRWQYLVRDGIHRWIELPRDVLRLANAVKFAWPALEGEIDPQDLLAMEGLRLFDEPAFKWVRDNRDFIFSEGRFRFGDDDACGAAIEQLKRQLPEGNKNQVLQVLSTLFPAKGKWFEDRGGFGGESYIEVQKRRGVGSEAGYDAYFGLRPSADEVPKAIIDSIVSNAEDTEELVTAMRSFLGRENSRHEPMITKLLSELRPRYESKDPALPTQALLDALFEIGEDVIATKWAGDMFIFSPRVHMGFLVDSMLKRWGTEEAGACLISAFERATSPAFCSDVFVARGRELGVFESDSREYPLISRDDFTKLGGILLCKIGEAAKSGTLDNAPFYFDVARSWAYLDTVDYPRAWLSEGAQRDPRFLVKVARGLVNDIYSAGGHHYEMRETPGEEFYDLEILLKSARKHLAGSDLSDDELQIVLELERGAKKYLSRDRSNEGTISQGPTRSQQG